MEAIKIIDNLVDDITCNQMIAIYDELFKEVKPSKDGRKLVRNCQDSRVLDFLKIYLPKVSDILQGTYYPRDILLSIYEQGAYLNPHIDYNEEQYINSLGVLFYFNDNFTGGEIYFTEFDFQYEPKKGSVLIFPCNQPYYTHGVKPVTNGYRYTMPLEITLNKDLRVCDI